MIPLNPSNLLTLAPPENFKSEQEEITEANILTSLLTIINYKALLHFLSTHQLTGDHHNPTASSTTQTQTWLTVQVSVSSIPG